MSVNFTLLVFVFIMLYLIVDGFGKGLIRKLVSLVTLLVLTVIVGIAVTMLVSYLSGSTMNLIVCAILLIMVLILHRVLSVLLVGGKISDKLPKPNVPTKILGALLGIGEACIILWLVYCMMGVMNLGPVGDRILFETENLPVLNWFWKNNLVMTILKALPIQLS